MCVCIDACQCVMQWKSVLYTHWAGHEIHGWSMKHISEQTQDFWVILTKSSVSMSGYSFLNSLDTIVISYWILFSKQHAHLQTTGHYLQQIWISNSFKQIANVFAHLWKWVNTTISHLHKYQLNISCRSKLITLHLRWIVVLSKTIVLIATCTIEMKKVLVKNIRTNS